MGKYSKFAFTLILCSLLASCLPYKQQVYWQFMNDVAKDSSSGVIFDPPKTVYRLQVDDIIDIQINSQLDEANSFFSKTFNNQSTAGSQVSRAGGSGDPFYMTGYIVDDSGYVKMPVLGKLLVEELTIAEVEELIEKELLHYFQPGMYYVVVKLGGLRFSVFGEVNSPGRYVVLERNYNVYQAISLFGDMTSLARKNDVYIMRKKEGKLVMKRVDLLDQEIFTSEYFYIMPNDIIYVRPARVKALGFSATFFQNFNTTLSFISTSLLFYATLRSLNN